MHQYPEFYLSLTTLIFIFITILYSFIGVNMAKAAPMAISLVSPTGTKIKGSEIDPIVITFQGNCQS